MTHAPRSRSGIVSIWVLIVLSVLTALSATVAWQFLAGRRVLRDRQNALQASWLARSGVETAAAHLLADSKYRGETLELLPDSRVEVQVEALADDSYRIHATARMPASRQGHVRTSSRTFHRTEAGGKARLEVVSPTR
jgi:type II secretory pathway component PulK